MTSLAPPPLSPKIATQTYAELHCISNFTFLRGASYPEELVAQAKTQGYYAIAITDECSLSGAVRAHVEAKRQEVKLIIGSEFHLTTNPSTRAPNLNANAESKNNINEIDRPEPIELGEKDCHLIFLSPNRRGYGELSHLISCARRRGSKGYYQIDRALVERQLPTECFVLWLPDLYESEESRQSQAKWLLHLFKGQLWIGAELLLRGDDRWRLTQYERLAAAFDIPLCASGGVYMHSSERQRLQDCLTAIRVGRSVETLGYEGEPNSQRHLRSIDKLTKLYPQALLDATTMIAKKCDFSLDELRYEYPKELVPEGYSASTWLRNLTETGIKRRWPNGESPKTRNLIERELRLIKKLNFEHYFLTVNDLVMFARRQGILCQGRGSAANSAVCYSLGITEVDPDRIELLFERFLSKERNEPPDIDVDFESGRREEVIQYLYSKYGRSRAALAATVVTYQSRSAIRDIGKVLNLENDLLDRVSKSICWNGSNLEEKLRDCNVNSGKFRVNLLIELAEELIGFPRHLSQHVGGFVLSQGPLSHLAPIENASMVDRTIIQWEKSDLEALSLLKIDVLSLGMLSAISKCLSIINESTNQKITVQDIPAEDPAVYDMICKADTVGVFQIESRAQMSMLPRLKPRNYYDLVVQIAIVRPGPIQGDMVHPYLNRRNGKELATYPSEAVKKTLKRTLGVPIFQEQVMQLAMVAAGFSGGEADALRRAMAAWKRKGGLSPYKEKLITGMLSHGYSQKFALQLFEQIKGFGEYGFPESHSASFALIAYVSSWLKHYHPAAFCCALLNSQPMGFYSPSQLIQDARRHGVTVKPIDVNLSDAISKLEKDTRTKTSSKKKRLRVGLNQVKGISQKAINTIIIARENKKFISVRDFNYRCQLQKNDLEALAEADAFKNLAGDRHQAFWQISAAESVKLFEKENSLNLKVEDDDFGVNVLLPTSSEGQNIIKDYNSTGFTLRRHPLSLFRAHLKSHNVNTASDLIDIQDKHRVKVMGLVTCRQRPMTASGVSFLTLEDESGSMNIIVWSKLSRKHRLIIRYAQLIGVLGRVQKNSNSLHVIASDLIDLSHWLGELTVKSHDFK